jgi:glycosyltransferase involved in cell wall biosynthesis
MYNEPSQGGIGGSEISVAVLAEALSRTCEVEIVHHRRSLTGEQLAALSGTSLSRVRLRYVAPDPYSFGSSHNPLRRYDAARSWQADLSKPYDLFINFTHGIPPFCQAPRGVLMVLFPLDELPYAQAPEHTSSVAPLWNQLKRAYHEFEWARRFDSYQIKIANSRFTEAWAKRRWGIDCQVVYPPVDTRYPVADKTDIILSVGRFATAGHSKKQLEMVSAFRQIQNYEPQGWQYYSVGALGGSTEDNAYFESVSEIAGNSRARVLANVERVKLRSIYGQAKIFWHAAGYGEADERPELAEHFGYVTVEAMASGCVPVVINKGGQPEIVEHAINGFLWDTLDELKGYTLMLMRDERLRSDMSKEARARANLFSREESLNRFLTLLRPLLC